jgi:hypothetical protein
MLDASHCDAPVLFQQDVRFVRTVPRKFRIFHPEEPGFLETMENRLRYFGRHLMEKIPMKKALAILATVATIGATAVTAPAEARGIGPGLAFGLAAGALTAGAVASAYGPYGYGPGYGYYGRPAYYAYGPGPYAYYGGRYYRHRYWGHHW